MSFLKRLKKSEPIIIDGAMGTLFLEKIPSYKDSFEKLNLIHPKLVEDIHRQYIQAGAEIIETNTFGASQLKLAEYGLAQKCKTINKKAAQIAQKAAKAKLNNGHKNKKIFVGGSIGPTGLLVEPMGDYPAEKIYKAFIPQVKGLVEGGADLIIIETMNDLQEAKLALMAAKEFSSLPIIANLTFEKNGSTISGTNMLTGFATLTQFGADIVGANCSMGPEGLLAIFKKNIKAISQIKTPLSVWSNAGLPDFKEGKAVYQLSPDKFATISTKLISLGVKVIGGCCGTTPKHIAALKQKISSFSRPSYHKVSKNKDSKKNIFLTSRSKTINLSRHKKLLIIGERLNPTAKKIFAQELKKNKYTYLRQEAVEQVREGADLLDINVGVPNLDETKAIHYSVTNLTRTVEVPLMIDSDNAEVVKKALYNYPGVSILNSINGTKESLKTFLPILKKFACLVVVLCLDETGIHREAKKRIQIGEKIFKLLLKEKIDPTRIFFDPLTLTESAEPGSALETLKVIKHFSRKKLKTIVGLSNISFGLPQRTVVNNVFLKLAIEQGLTAAIANPAKIKKISRYSQSEKLAYNFLLGQDPGAEKYILTHKNKLTPKKTFSLKVDNKKENDLKKIYEAVLLGHLDEIEDSIKIALPTHQPQKIMDQSLLRALEEVGERYSRGEYFLPQMIASANTMKRGFKILKPLLAKKNKKNLGKIIICTVKGDIHDIGKNIVAMMLENHGFEVHDLGKDISLPEIITATKKIKPDLICLSSLLTTTMNEMKKIKEALYKNNLRIKLLIGGAVITNDYAREIGSYYGQNAVEAVKRAKEILK